MTRLLEILISIAIVTALFLLVALVLPSRRHLTEKVETNRRMSIVFDTLNSFRRFKDWNALTLRDPALDIELSGPPSGVGATMNYRSGVPTIGSGSWKIITSEPGKMVGFAIEDISRGHNKRTEFTLTPTGRGRRNIEIKQDYHVDYGFNLLGRYAGLYISRHVGDNMQLGLQRLSTMLASVPNVDYVGMRSTGMGEISMVERPAENLLVVNAGSVNKSPGELQYSMRQQMEWIKRTLDASGLSSAGPMRIRSTEVGTSTYAFDVIVPVRRGAAPAPATATGDDEPAATPAPPPAAAAELTGLKLQGPVKHEFVPPTRVVATTFKGFQGNLENVRNALRAWALTNGLETTALPVDIYVGGDETAFTDNGEFEVYWPIK